MKNKIIHITASSQTLTFILGHCTFQRDHGYDVRIVTSPDNHFFLSENDIDMNIDMIKIEREIKPINDILSLYKLTKYLFREKPLIVHTHTPKASLLGITAATLAGVPVRIYHLHGIRYLTKRGLNKKLLKLIEYITAKLSTRILSVSLSNLDAFIKDGICRSEKIEIINWGSISGVDAKTRFNRIRLKHHPEIQKKTHSNKHTVGFIGRIVKDKGIEELLTAWMIIRNEYPDWKLLLVGEFEKGDSISDEVKEIIRKDNRIEHRAWQRRVEYSFYEMDLFVLPSHREGFGLVAIEASAMKIPVVATRIPGCVDSVENGVSGTLVELGNITELVNALKFYMDSPDVRIRIGQNGRKRVLNKFVPRELFQGLLNIYDREIKKMDIPSN